MLSEKQIQNASRIFIVLPKALGDLIASEPIVRYLHRLNPKAKLVWVADKVYSDFLLQNPFLFAVVGVDSWKEAFDFISSHATDVVVDCCYDGKICPITKALHRNPHHPEINESTYYDYGTLLETFCETAGLPPLKDGPQVYGREPLNDLPENYVVFHCLSSEAARNWDKEKWNRLAEWLFEHKIPLVEIGYEKVIQTPSPFYHSFCGKRTLSQINTLIEKSTLFVGVDSGFAHIANALQKQAVILLGRYRNFAHPMPYNGYFEKNALLLYPSDNGTVQNLTLEEVKEAIFSKLFQKRLDKEF